MNAKTLLRSLTIFAVLGFSAGCSDKIVYVPQEVLVPVHAGCKIEHPPCSHDLDTHTEILTEARLCIRRYRLALDYCRE